MAGTRDHGWVAFSREKAVVGHLRFAHHVRDVTKVEPQTPVRGRTADDQQAVQAQLVHHPADIIVAPLVLGFGETRVRKALLHACHSSSLRSMAFPCPITVGY